MHIIFDNVDILDLSCAQIQNRERKLISRAAAYRGQSRLYTVSGKKTGHSILGITLTNLDAVS